MKKSAFDRTNPVKKGEVETPIAALKRLKEGHQRFLDRKPLSVNLDNFIKKTGEDGQGPFALVLSCIDSRVPVELIFDQSVGDIFNAKIAGNFVNEDILGSMEFATGYVKLIVVMGHTACGAINAACEAVYPSAPAPNQPCEAIPPANLGQMVEKLIPAVLATPQKEKTKPGESIVDKNQVAETNVRLTINNILTRSQTPIRKLCNQGKLMIVGAMYDVRTGEVRFLDEQPGEAVA